MSASRITPEGERNNKLLLGIPREQRNKIRKAKNDNVKETTMKQKSKKKGKNQNRFNKDRPKSRKNENNRKKF